MSEFKKCFMDEVHKIEARVSQFLEELEKSGIDIYESEIKFRFTKDDSGKLRSEYETRVLYTSQELLEGQKCWSK